MIKKEISALWDKINDISKQLSGFSDMLHAQSQSDITDLQEATTDIIFNQINDELLPEEEV